MSGSDSSKLGTGNRKLGTGNGTGNSQFSAPSSQFPVVVRALLVALVLAATALGADEKRVRGTVLQVQGDTVTINVGREAGVKDRAVFDVFVDARAVRLPMTSETVYVPQRVLAQLVVVSVEAKTAQAKVVPVSGDGAVPKVDGGALIVSNPFAIPKNLAPFLKAVAADPRASEFGRPVTVKVVWADDKEDLVYFDWSATGGALAWARSAVPQVVWSPPLVEKKTTFKVTVTAVDTAGNRSAQTIDVEVGPPGAQKSVYEPRRRLADHGEAFSVCRDLAFDEENGSYVIDSYKVQLIGRDHQWAVTLRTDEYQKDVKQLDRLVVQGGDAYFTDLYWKRAVKMRIGPKMYQDDPVVLYGGEGTGNGQFAAPADIAVDPKGSVYVLDGVRCCVQIFAQDGRFESSIGAPGTGPGQMQRPVAMGLAHDGTLYVLDDGRKQILKFRDRLFTGEFEAGAKSDAFSDLKVDPMSGRVCILESKVGQVRSFDASGQPQGAFGQQGETLALGTFDRPTRLRFDRLGSLYVIATDGKVIHRCNPAAGEEMARWGGVNFAAGTDIAAGPQGDLAVLLPKLYVVANLDRMGWVKGLCGGEGMAPGKLRSPIGVAVGAAGEICVVDQKQQKIQVFDPRGVPLRVIGKEGDGPTDIYYPMDLAIDPSRRYLALLEDRKNFEVKVYDLKAKPGEELRAAMPADKEVLDDQLVVAITPSGLTHVVLDGGGARSFNTGPALAPNAKAMLDGTVTASEWRVEGVKVPRSLAVSNQLLLFAADPKTEQVQVIDLSRRGAVVTQIKDPKAVGEPAVATVDDYDRVFVWDADNTRAVEFGR